MLVHLLGGKTTNANLTTRNTTIKKDKEIFDQQRLSIKSSTNSSTGGLNLGVKDELEEFSDDYEDEYSYSLSGQSTPVPPTPEPPAKTPTPTITAEMFLKSPSPHSEKVSWWERCRNRPSPKFLIFDSIPDRNPTRIYRVWVNLPIWPKWIASIGRSTMWLNFYGSTIVQPIRMRS